MIYKKFTVHKKMLVFSREVSIIKKFIARNLSRLIEQNIIRMGSQTLEALLY